MESCNDSLGCNLHWHKTLYANCLHLLLTPGSDSLASIRKRLRQVEATQVDVLVEGWDQDGNVVGRTQWDAPDVDPLVFLYHAATDGIPDLKAGQMRRCLVTGTSLFDLEATPAA